MKSRYVFTVFTPTYNRAHTLPRVYDSLKNQTYKNFEWLIVDDGSTDETESLVTRWIKEGLVPIRYFYKENGGKHTAMNLGIAKARGLFFLTLDSDDGCLPRALERFRYYWKTIPPQDRGHFSAVTGLCVNQFNRPVGGRFPTDIFDSEYLSNLYIHKIGGEKWGFQRTAVMKEFPFPEPSEKLSYVPEGIVWGAIARKYKTRYVNEYLRVYYDAGPESSLVNQKPEKIALARRIGHLNVLNNHLDFFSRSPKLFILSAAQYVRFSLHAKRGLFRQLMDIDSNAGRGLFVLALPLGVGVFLMDKLGMRKSISWLKKVLKR